MRDISLRRAGALCSHLWQEQEACIPHVNTFWHAWTCFHQVHGDT